MTYFLIIIFGLVVGSFLNAVIFRIRVGKSFIDGRSECMHCHHQLAASDLIPVVSFLYLNGRCRYCHKAISWQYPFVEALTALLFLLSFIQFGFSMNFLWSIIFFGFILIIGIYDYKHYLILDKVIVPAAVLAVLKNIVLDITNHQALYDLRSFTLDGLFGGLIISGFFAVQYYISRGKWIGFGDVKLGVFLGLLFGVKLGVLMLILAYFIGALTGIGLIIQGRKHLGSKLPLGSFLSVSAIIVIIWGNEIFNWYLGLIGL